MLSSSAEVSIKVSALGLHLRDGPQLALQNAELICHARRRMADTAVTLDVEDHTTTDSTLEILRNAAQEVPCDWRCAAGIFVPHRPRRLPGPRRWQDRGVRLCEARTRSLRA